MVSWAYHRLVNLPFYASQFSRTANSALASKKNYVKLTNAFLSSDVCEKKAVGKQR